jgi:DNA-directed RNA polymerase subunit N
MIIPIRCFTCGKVLADKWNYYKQKAAEHEEKNLKKVPKTDDDLSRSERDPKMYFDSNIHKQLLDELGLDRMCCRRHMLTHIDLIDII